MALAITAVPEAEVPLGPANFLRTLQLTPGVSDYTTGGYAITAAQLGLTYILAAQIVAKNAAATPYQADVVFPAGSFGTTPKPASTINLKISQPQATIATNVSTTNPLYLTAGSITTTGTAGTAQIADTELANGTNLTGLEWFLEVRGY